MDNQKKDSVMESPKENVMESPEENESVMDNTGEKEPVDLVQHRKMAKKAYSFAGLSLSVFILVSTAAQLLVSVFLLDKIPKDLFSQSTLSFLLIIFSMYIIAFPVYALMNKKREKTVIEKHKMKWWEMIVAILMMAGMVSVGAIVGFVINLVIVLLTGAEAANVNSLADMMTNSNFFLRVLTVGILAPIVEELVMRKILIDRIVKYGELMAILFSGLAFGLIHGNINQFIFATFVGMFSAFIYIRTGRIIYSIILHMALNLTTSVITSTLADWAMRAMANNTGENGMMMEGDIKTMLPILVFTIWFLLLGFICFVGEIILLVNLGRKKLRLQTTECQVESNLGLAIGTVGGIVFILASCVLYALNYVPLFIK